MTTVLLATMGIFLLLSIPIGIALGGASWLALVIEGKIPALIVTQRLMSGINHFTMIAVIFFILAGEVMTEGGISKKLVALANRLVGKLPGGLAMVATLSAMFFGAISGSSAATTAAIGGIMMPTMDKAGYKRDFSSAVIAASGLLGLLIPPSGTMLLYAVIANTSVLEMFLAGIIPGVFMGLCLMVTSYIISKKRGYGSVPLKEEVSEDSKGKVIFHSFLALLSPVIILGGIYSGAFTATEAAGIAVLYGLIVGYFLLKQLTLKNIYRSFVKTGISSSVILFLIGAAAVFGWLLTIQQIPNKLIMFISGFTDSPAVVLLLVNISLLIAGALLDNVAAITLLTPVLVPLVVSFGIDPTFFGVIMIINLAIGQITPPIGMNLFVASNISGVKLEKIVVQVIPYLVVLIANLMLFTYVPWFVTFLPNLVMK
ncbi:MAG: TRAP transporter large permease [Tissierellales bacterium]|nr:TRAP transporter large permease [Tissierellales bacterium]MBN2826697.1 TRAP transporter large permease [Tissierellales bacterium]